MSQICNYFIMVKIVSFINKTRFVMVMIQFPLAYRLCRQAERMRPSLDRVMAIVRATAPRVRMTEEETYLYNSLHRRVAEVYVEEQLRMAAQTIPELVELVRIPDGYETDKYIFCELQGTSIVKSKETRKVLTDIDGLVSIAKHDGKKGAKNWYPFLVEVKMGSYHYFEDLGDEGNYLRRLKDYVLGKNFIIDSETGKGSRIMPGHLNDLVLLSKRNVRAKNRVGMMYNAKLFRLYNAFERMHFQDSSALDYTEALDKLFRTKEVIDYIRAEVSYQSHVFRKGDNMEEDTPNPNESRIKAYPSSLAKIIVNPREGIKGIDPVLDYFRDLYRKGEHPNWPSDIGIIVAMPPDNINTIREGGQKRFVEKGGNIITFPTPLRDYAQLIYAMADKHGFKIA